MAFLDSVETWFATSGSFDLAVSLLQIDAHSAGLPIRIETDATPGMPQELQFMAMLNISVSDVGALFRLFACSCPILPLQIMDLKLRGYEKLGKISDNYNL
ncbi:MAG: hypothetical protein ACYC9L_06490 [Sulfuricaulis sp.]